MSTLAFNLFRKEFFLLSETQKINEKRGAGKFMGEKANCTERIHIFVFFSSFLNFLHDSLVGACLNLSGIK